MVNVKRVVYIARGVKQSIDAWLRRAKARIESRKAFNYDRCIFSKYAGALNRSDAESACAEITMAYHIIEKGLTMPKFRRGFGKAAAERLIDLIDAFEARFGECAQVAHATAVLKAYKEKNGFNTGDFEKLDSFLSAHEPIEAAVEPHVTKEQFYAFKEAPFPQFAASRHMVRHFAKSVPRETLMKAVEIATSAPSACNRQPVRVHIIEDREIMERLLAIQSGSRGFGTSADKLIIITSSLKCIRWGWERHDPYTNGGIFAMNLCNALHYCEVAHCVLHWSISPAVDKEAHKLVGIPEDEAIVLLIACALPPDEFDVAASPRLKAKDIVTWHGENKR